MSAARDKIMGGRSTARVRAVRNRAEALEREANQAVARQCLTRRGADDLLEMLGLVPASPRPRRRADDAAAPQPRRRTYPTRVCEVCQVEYEPRNRKQRACNRSHGAKLGYLTKTRLGGAR